MEETDIAYLAGIVDGDGSISIAKCTRYKGRCRYWLQLNVTNCSKELVEWIKDRYGGTIQTKTPTTKGRAIYRWCLANQNAEYLIEELVDYLIVKKDQAYVALEFRNTYGKTDYRQGGLSQDIIDMRDVMREAVSKLNRGEEL